MGEFDRANGAQAGFGNQSRETCPIGRHRIVSEGARAWKSTADARVKYYGVDFTILEPDPTSSAKSGGKHTAMEQYEGNQYQSHSDSAIAVIKGWVGAHFGQDIGMASAVTGVQIQQSIDNQLMLAGNVLDIEVTHKTTKAGQKIAKIKMFPVLDAQGRPVTAAIPGAAPATPGMPAPGFQGARTVGGAAPAPAPAAAPAPAPAPSQFPPAGWTEHTAAPGNYFKAGMTTCILEAELRSLMALGKA